MNGQKEICKAKTILVEEVNLDKDTSIGKKGKNKLKWEGDWVGPDM